MPGQRGFKRGYRISGKVVTGRVRRSVFGPDAWERRGDAQRFGPQAFESRSLRRFIDAGFSFHIRTVGVFRCAHTDRELCFCLVYATVQRTEFSATRITTCFSLNGHTIANRRSKWTLDNGTLDGLYDVTDA